MDLHHDVASDGNGTSDRLVPARPSSPTRTEPLAALPLSDPRHLVETRFKLAWVKVKKAELCP
jgi:hypothetical protein